VRNCFGPTPFIGGRTGVPRPVPPSREPPSSRHIERAVRPPSHRSFFCRSSLPWSAPELCSLSAEPAWLRSQAETLVVALGELGPVRSSQVQSGPVRSSQAQSGRVRPSQPQSASQAELRKSCRPHRWERRRNAKVTASAHGDGAARVLRIDGTAPHAQNRPAKRRHQAAAGAPSAGRIGATLTAEVEVPPPRAAKCECTSQTLAHRMMVPPATTSRMIPQSHQSFLSPDLRIACITVGQMSGSGSWRRAVGWQQVDFPDGSHDIAVALTLPWSPPTCAQVFSCR
jgi:hypothetical protein